MRTRTIILLETAMVLFSFLVLIGPGYSNIPLPNPHNDINDEVTCLSCHDTYFEGVDEHEFVVGVTRICDGCHELADLGRTHPYDFDVSRSRMEGLEIPDELPLVDGEMTCGSCHDPHMAYLSTTPSFRGQYAESGFSDDYFLTYFARMSDPDQGFDPLCAACHPDH